MDRMRRVIPIITAFHREPGRSRVSGCQPFDCIAFGLVDSESDVHAKRGAENVRCRPNPSPRPQQGGDGTRTTSTIETTKSRQISSTSYRKEYDHEMLASHW
jgi:hypothetical protein